MIIFDATMLMLAVNPQAGKPIDPSTQKPVEHVEQRINYLLSLIDKQRAKIGIPSPALAEAMVKTDIHPSDLVKAIQSFAVFQILHFDEKAAIELALINRNALSTGDKKEGSAETWAKIKFDRQIAAIAKVVQAHTVYTDDGGLRNACQRQQIAVVGLADMTLPPPAAQIEMFTPDQNRTDPVDLDEDEHEDEAQGA